MGNKNEYSSALLVMDMQAMIIGNITDPTEVIENAKSCIAKARKNNILVIYVVLGFRPGFPEISENNASFTAYKERLLNLDLNEMTKIHPELAPLPNDIIVTKRRISAFTGSDLEVILRSRNIKHLVLTGVATSGVVLSTFCEAIDKDYKLTLISNACKDRNEQVHQLLMSSYFPNRATVVTAEDWN